MSERLARENQKEIIEKSEELGTDPDLDSEAGGKNQQIKDVKEQMKPLTILEKLRN